MLHDGDDGEYNGVGFVQTSKIFASQDAFFFGNISFDKIYLNIRAALIKERLNDGVK